MELILEQFHFLRPQWFWLIVPAVLLFVFLRIRQQSASNWEASIDASLLPQLLDSSAGVKSKSPLYLLLIAWLLATVSMAGPVWEKQPQPVHEREDAMVILLDLSLSMYATDVKPDRLTQAQRKLFDLLKLRDEGVTALVAYAGDAYTVSPLTDDANTIASLVPALGPDIMPEPGSRLTPALEAAIRLFENAGAATGRILVVTDQIWDIANAQSLARRYNNQYPVSVLAVGTPEGSPVPMDHLEEGLGFLKDENGVIVVPRVDLSSLKSFTSVAGGRFSQLTLSDQDLNYLLTETRVIDEEMYRILERDFDVWFENGPWLLLLLLPIAAFAFRRGYIWSLVLCAVILPSNRATALEWDDLWLTPDQRGERELAAGNPAGAAQQFERQDWQAAAHYKSENYAEAAELLSEQTDPDSHYNRGNALAKLGDYQGALDAYDQALQPPFDNEDARFNRELVKKLLEQQQQEQDQNQQDGDSEENQQDGDQQQEGEPQSDEEGSESENSSESEESEEQQTQEQQQAEQTESGQEEAEDEQAAEDEESELEAEERQALEQWLRRVPDDPGGLLRRKFEKQNSVRLKNGQQSPRTGVTW